jgi:hypothetical protein
MSGDNLISSSHHLRPPHGLAFEQFNSSHSTAGHDLTNAELSMCEDRPCQLVLGLQVELACGKLSDLQSAVGERSIPTGLAGPGTSS